MTIITALDSSTQVIEVAGVAVTVTLSHEDGYWVATHADTGAWGFARTEEGALADVSDCLRDEKDWYCTTGADLPMTGALVAKRTAYERLFGTKAVKA